ncbi:MAG TPA: CARDB domain-containing protein [Candidatus Thermoplasmatota archaeon]
MSAEPELRPGDEWLVDRAWSADVWVSQAAGPDLAPAVWADENLTATVLWKANRSGRESWWAHQTNTTAPVASAGSFITDRTEGAWGRNYTYGVNVAVDDQGRVFYVFTKNNNTSYVQTDALGNVLVGPKVIVPSTGERILDPAVAVFPNGTAAVVYENATLPGPSRSDIDVILIDDDGEVIWGPRRVTTDVSTRAYFPAVAVNRWTGDILITFRSLGIMLTRFSFEGYKAMGSREIGSGSLDAAVQPVPMPNGDIQLFWANYGRAFLSLFNRSGQQVVSARQISDASAANISGVRGAALSDGRSVAVWSDNRTGSRDVFFGTVRPGHEGDSHPPPNIRLTNQTGNATDPWIAADPWDNLHVVWSDARGGDMEVRYKRSFQCGATLSADPYDIAAMFFVLPGETKELPMALKNTGYWPANLSLTLDVDGGPALSNWSVSLNQTRFNGASPGEPASVRLRMSSPANAREGESISIAITAYTNCSLAGESVFSFPSYVRFPRAIGLTFDQEEMAARAGDIVEFKGRVENLENITEDDVTIQQVIGATSDDVWVSMNTSTVTVQPYGSASISAHFYVPEDAVPGSALRAVVTAFSSVDTTVRSNANLTVLVDRTVSIALDARPDLQTAPAGADVNFTLWVRNTGNSQVPAQITMGVAEDALGSVLSVGEVWVAGASNGTIGIVAHVPPSASDGERLALTVIAAAPGFDARATATMWVVVDANRRVGIDVQPTAPTAPGLNTTVEVTVSNSGSAPEEMDVEVIEAPPGWTAQPGDPSNITVAAGETTTTTVVVKAPTNQPPGESNITVCFCKEGEPPLELVIAIAHAGIARMDLEVVGALGSTIPGGNATFDLLLHSTGNLDTTARISCTGLPPGSSWVLTLTEALGVAAAGSAWDETVVLPAGSTARLRMVVHTTDETPGAHYPLEVSATNESGASDLVLLDLEVYDADLRLTTILLDPTNPRSRDLVTVAVRIINDDRSNKSNVTVDLQDNGVTVATAATGLLRRGGDHVVLFSWTATPGEHRLTARADPATPGGWPWGEIHELDETNNEVSVVLTVPDGSAGGQPFGDAALLIGVAIAMAAAAFAYAIARRRASRDR